MGVSRVQCKFSRTVGKFLDNLSYQDSNTIKRAMVGGTREGHHGTSEIHGEDTVGGSLWRETLGGVWDRMMQQNQSVGCDRVVITRKRSLAPPLSRACIKTGCSSLTHNGVLHKALDRYLSERKVQFVIEAL